jgi:glycosyltransferase involved in cell wall biosynthesis
VASDVSSEPTPSQPEPLSGRIAVTVVVPVYNGGPEIVANVETIRSSVQRGLPGETIEVVVVSDGSIDDTAERLLAARTSAGIRVIHYDRNLGKGYAVKTGALAAEGDWVAIVDADLDLDPAAIPAYLEVGRRERLDLVVGSKRHPGSVVHYPRSRRIASWCYQQLNRILFGLDLRDTQVGLKVFSRGVTEDVVPLLLVKRFAFDLELLAVSNALGHDRVREMPVTLDYRFTGSEVTSLAALRTLWDTAAIFYRLRILRTYRRKRTLIVPAKASAQPITMIGDPRIAATLDYEALEVLDGDPYAVPAAARGDLLAVLEPGARPAGNWVSAAIPYFSRPEIAAVVVPELAPTTSSLRERVAAAVLESRLGGGSRRFRYLPGNVRITRDHPAPSVIVRRSDFAAALGEDVDSEHLVAWLADRGRQTVYTPDTSISSVPAPVIGPHLHDTVRHARARGEAARRTRGRSVSGATALSLAPAALALVGLGLLASGATLAGATLLLAYAAAVVISALFAGMRFRSVAVALLAAPALVATHAAYLAGFALGLVRRT